jgi:hypothetical protein
LLTRSHARSLAHSRSALVRLQLSFGVKVPNGDGTQDADDHQELTLEGWESFDAAVFCASLSAGARDQKRALTPDKAGGSTNKRKAIETPGRVFRKLFGGKLPDDRGIEED